MAPSNPTPASTEMASRSSVSGRSRRMADLRSFTFLVSQEVGVAGLLTGIGRPVVHARVADEVLQEVGDLAGDVHRRAAYGIGLRPLITVAPRPGVLD